MILAQCPERGGEDTRAKERWILVFCVGGGAGFGMNGVRGFTGFLGRGRDESGVFSGLVE